ncbi:MAG: pyruvate kinase [Candidatus Omnitrophica bacterium]|nr:pyruvate kinase [Candidatus Omnitrophota bacterium]
MDKTKIIATLGPASNESKILRKMIFAGADVFRLNFSHGSHEEHLERIKLIRALNKKYRRHIRILQDLEGFRIRIGKLPNTGFRELKKHSKIWLTNEPGRLEKEEIPIDYKNDLSIIGAGEIIYIDDGNLAIKTVKSYKKNLQAEVLTSGILKERKGINIPGVKFPGTGLTEKDKKDLAFGLTHKVDWVAQSFVRKSKDVKILKDIVKKHCSECPVVAKIETREAIRDIDSIIDVADGIMVARGDMGVSVPIYEIPMIQKEIIRKCNKKKKIVITATQMLEHMTEHAWPTRAEVTDVANAIIDGTNYVMLSAESASGAYPVESVEMMTKIIRYTERYMADGDLRV